MEEHPGCQIQQRHACCEACSVSIKLSTAVPKLGRIGLSGYRGVGNVIHKLRRSDHGDHPDHARSPDCYHHLVSCQSHSLFQSGDSDVGALIHIPLTWHLRYRNNMKRSLLSIFLLTALAAIACASVSDPVHIDQGLLSGTAGKNADVRIYRGIPYAAPPVGDLRWKAPQPPAAWKGV